MSDYVLMPVECVDIISHCEITDHGCLNVLDIGQDYAMYNIESQVSVFPGQSMCSCTSVC